MTIKRKLKKYNKEIHRREEYIDDSKEFHSIQEIKDYCIEHMNKNGGSLYDNTVYSFVIEDTDEDIKIIAQWINDDDGFYYVKLEYDL